MDLEWCLACGQRTRSPSAYCSHECRKRDDNLMPAAPIVSGLYASPATTPFASSDSSDNPRQDGFFSFPTTSNDYLVACSPSSGAPALLTTPSEAPTPSPSYPTLSFARRSYNSSPTSPLPPLPPSVHSKRLSYEFWAQNNTVKSSMLLNTPPLPEKTVWQVNEERDGAV